MLLKELRRQKFSSAFREVDEVIVTEMKNRRYENLH
jgi:hypothetical protein